jgi:hypothetical protein
MISPLGGLKKKGSHTSVDRQEKESGIDISPTTYTSEPCSIRVNARSSDLLALDDRSPAHYLDC